MTDIGVGITLSLLRQPVYPDKMPSITVYSKPSCQACRLTYKQLEKVGVDYRAVDITEDPEAMELVRRLGYLSAPVVVAGEESWDGFRPDKIRALAPSE